VEGKGGRENMLFGGSHGIRSLFQGHSPGGASLCNDIRWGAQPRMPRSGSASNDNMTSIG